jgi:hypothetical protein
MPVMAETITTASGRLLVLAFDRQVEIVRYVFGDFIACAVRVDVPAVPSDRQCEGQQQ